jgi:hypothetical protein
MELGELLTGSMLSKIGVMVLLAIGAVTLLIWRMGRSKSLRLIQSTIGYDVLSFGRHLPLVYHLGLGHLDWLEKFLIASSCMRQR